MINWNPKFGVSIAAGLMIIAHLLYPDIEIDAFTIALLIIASYRGSYRGSQV